MNRNDTTHTPEFDPTDLDATTRARLRAMDPAPAHLTEEQLRRKDATLAAVLGGTEGDRAVGADGERAAAAPDVVRMDQRRRHFGTGSQTTRSTHHARRRWLVPAGAAAALAGALVVANLTGGAAPAYATWTADAQPLSTEATQEAVNSCLEHSQESIDASQDEGAPIHGDLSTAVTALAEQRGEVAMVTLVAADGSAFSCFYDRQHLDHPDGATASVATSSSEPLGPLAADGVEVLGGGWFGDGETTLATMIARVGSDVQAVTVHADGNTLQATVQNGVLGAWWPVQEEGGPTIPEGMDPVLDITLKDGTVLEGVRPTGTY